jgi:hypothetical protein
VARDPYSCTVVDQHPSDVKGVRGVTNTDSTSLGAAASSVTLEGNWHLVWSCHGCVLGVISAVQVWSIQWRMFMHVRPSVLG